MESINYSARFLFDVAGLLAKEIHEEEHIRVVAGMTCIDLGSIALAKDAKSCWNSVLLYANTRTINKVKDIVNNACIYSPNSKYLEEAKIKIDVYAKKEKDRCTSVTVIYVVITNKEQSRLRQCLPQNISFEECSFNDDLNCYDLRRRNWKAFNPPHAETIGTEVGSIMKQKNSYISETHNFNFQKETPQDFIEILEDCKEKKDLVIVIVDNWSLFLDEYATTMKDYSKKNFYHCGTLIVRNVENDLVNKNEDCLQDLVDDIFYNENGKKHHHNTNIVEDIKNLEPRLFHVFNSVVLSMNSNLPMMRRVKKPAKKIPNTNLGKQKPAETERNEALTSGKVKSKISKNREYTPPLPKLGFE
ncbi:hypothetical protein [Candidatus Uabimicrobium sp. HlEnr_7]|uniref:hypothetical protein n=1 Tax=Candidatus Uabimicrobium helgolandensis TaxID=3095367 RepID=UPI0035567E37